MSTGGELNLPHGRRARGLTGPQTELLRFLAGRQDVPGSLRSSMYTALSERGLIERNHRRAYELTELGRRLLSELDDPPAENAENAGNAAPEA